MILSISDTRKKVKIFLFSPGLCYNVREKKNKRREATFVFLRDNEQTVCEADNKQVVRVCEFNVYAKRKTSGAKRKTRGICFFDWKH